MKKLVGNAVVGQSGGPSSAINATLAGIVRGVWNSEINDGCINKIYGMRNGIEGFLEEKLLPIGEILNEENIVTLEHTPAAALGSCRKKLPSPSENTEIYEKILAIFKKYDIRYFFYIGGNDSMDTVAKLSEFMSSRDYDMRVVGVPKTIDNDLMITDHSPGYGSAAKFVSTTMQEIIRDCAVYRTPAVTIVEIMGRNAGWLAAASDVGRFAGGVSPDAVYFPERNFDMEKFFSDVENALKKHPNVVVAVSEGVRFADGGYVGEDKQSGVVDVFGHKYLAGAGKVLESKIKVRFGCKVRSIELSLPQRCAAHIASATDISESVRLGQSAVSAACQDGASGEMMLYRRVSNSPYVCEIEHADIRGIANEIQWLHDDFINDTDNGITKACAEYIIPLIEGEAYPEYNNGIPRYFVF